MWHRDSWGCREEDGVIGEKVVVTSKGDVIARVVHTKRKVLVLENDGLIFSNRNGGCMIHIWECNNVVKLACDNLILIIRHLFLAPLISIIHFHCILECNGRFKIQIKEVRFNCIVINGDCYWPHFISHWPFHRELILFYSKITLHMKLWFCLIECEMESRLVH